MIVLSDALRAAAPRASATPAPPVPVRRTARLLLTSGPRPAEDGLLAERSQALTGDGWTVVPFHVDASAPLSREVLDRLVGELRAAALPAVDVWGEDPQRVLEAVEHLWHHSVLTSVLLDPRSAGVRAALSSSSPATGGAGARALLEVCAYADVVVLGTGAPTTLLESCPPPFGSLRVGNVQEVPVAHARARVEDAPGLTVLVSSYDRPAALRSCLEALTRQTLPPGAFEVLVVDDASPHPVDDVVSGFSGRLAVRLLHLEENHGPGGARTLGLEHVRTPVTLLMDDDDLPEPQCLEEHLAAHQANPQENLAVLGGTSVLPGGTVTALSRHVMTVGRQYFAYPGVQPGRLNPWRAFWCGRSSAKTTLLRRHAFRTAFMEDADFAFRARQDGLQVLYVKQAVQTVTERLDLEHFHRRQNRIGHAMLDLATACQDEEVWTWAGIEPVATNLAQWVAHRQVLRDIVDRLSPLPLQQLRSTPHGQASALELLDGALFIELDAHYAAGLLAALRRRRAELRGRPLVFGMAHDDPQAEQAVDRLAGEEWAAAVVVAPDAVCARAFVHRLQARPDGVPANLEVVDGDAPATLQDVDLVLPGSLPPAWHLGLPVPLIGQPVTDWISQLQGNRSPKGALR